MRRNCERPGCGAPSAVIYGYGSGPAGANGPGTMWLDAWSPDRDPTEAPADVRGVVCARHGALLSPPRGWALDDRRESIPRLFKPRDRGALTVVPDEEPEAPKKVKRDPTAPTRRPKAADLPRPRLFADLDESAPAPVVEPVVVPEQVVVPAQVVAEPLIVQPEPLIIEPAPMPVAEPAPVSVSVPVPEVVPESDPESEPVVADDSTELLIRQDATGSTSRSAATFDPDEDFSRDATGPMLRDALRPRLSGRFDPTAELLRPTDIDSEHA